MTQLPSHDRVAATAGFAFVLLIATLAAGAVVVTRLTLDLLAWTGQAIAIQATAPAPTVGLVVRTWSELHAPLPDPDRR